MAVRRRLRRRPARACQRGSGTAIGIAILFPMLLLVIMVIQAITFATRTEQALQAAADRAAHTAALCCLYVDDALAMAEQSLAVYARIGPGRRLDCANDVVGDAAIVFRDVASAEVPALDAGGGPNIVPSGGQAAVLVRCRLPVSRIGAFGFLGSNVDRNAIGIATLDPGRHRSTTVTP